MCISRYGIFQIEDSTVNHTQCLVPPSPDYIPSPEEPQSPPPLDFVPEPMYPEYMPQEDEILPAEEQPLHDASSPTAEHQDMFMSLIRSEGAKEDNRDYTTTSKEVGADYGFVSTMDTEIRRQRANEVGYGIRDVWVDPREAVEEVAPMTIEGVNTRVTGLATVQEQDTQDIYAVIGDTQDRQTDIYQSVKTLVDESQYHYEIARLLDQEALVSHEAWGCYIE
ncbi:hypothetical protein Tco_1343141, partial [Tanacetum coccineum]